MKSDPPKGTRTFAGRAAACLLILFPMVFVAVTASRGTPPSCPGSPPRTTVLGSLHGIPLPAFPGAALASPPDSAAPGRDLEDVRRRGVLRHLGIPYANFVTGSGDGLDVEMIQLFAQHLGVRYEFVKTTWSDSIGDLTGFSYKVRGDDAELAGQAHVKGDLLANGFTVLPWRQKVLDYSTPTFPTQVWLVARSDSPLQPIRPGGELQADIAAVRAMLESRTVLGKLNTCLDPSLYNIETAKGRPLLFKGELNELGFAVINGEADVTLLDVPDALIALDKWPGQIKILGPLTPPQEMACAFSKNSPRLREAFNSFLAQCLRDGTYLRLVDKYYPDVFRYFPGFFKGAETK